MAKRKLIRWGTVDWSLQDIVIAEKKGVSRERVRQVRRDLGEEKPDRSRCRRESAYKFIKKLDTPTLTLREIEKKTGYTSGHIRNVLEKLELSCRFEDLRRCGKYKWDTVEEKDYYLLKDWETAKRLGIKNPGVVTLHRIRKFFLKRIVNLSRISEAEFDSLSDQEVADRVDMKVQAITQYRKAKSNNWVKWISRKKVLA